MATVNRASKGALVGQTSPSPAFRFQGTMRNPLAAPTIAGVTAGAGLTATAAMVFWDGLPAFLPLIAFAGAIAAAFAVYFLSRQPGLGTSPVRLVLAGVAVASMLGAFTTGLMTMFSDRVQPVVLWMAGSLAGGSWDHLALVWAYSAVGLAGAFPLARRLNAMQLGDAAARGLGVGVERSRFIVIALASLLAASAARAAGLVGFVGLMTPHMMRLLGGHNRACLIGASAIGGAALMARADLGARMALAPLEIPVGVLTALIGGAFFALPLVQNRIHRRKGAVR